MAYNKADIASKIAQKSNLTKAQAEAALNAFQEVFFEAIESGEGLRLTGLFSAEVKTRAARKGHNPQTGEEMMLPASKSVHFTVGLPLKRAANGKK